MLQRKIQELGRIFQINNSINNLNMLEDIRVKILSRNFQIRSRFNNNNINAMVSLLTNSRLKTSAEFVNAWLSKLKTIKPSPMYVFNGWNSNGSSPRSVLQNKKHASNF